MVARARPIRARCDFADQFLTNAVHLKADPENATTPLVRFILAYEGIYYVALAFVAHLGARRLTAKGTVRRFCCSRHKSCSSSRNMARR